MSDLSFLRPAGQAGFVDSGITKAADLVNRCEAAPIDGPIILGAPLSKPSISHSGASFAPEAIRKMLSSFTTYAVEDDIDLKGIKLHDCGDILMHVTDIRESQQRIETTVAALFNQNPGIMPILFGGDHSVSCPSIKGFAKAKGNVGVIQFDAHHDLRNLEDGGPSNGTPFRGLLESGVLTGENLIQIGIRNFSNSKHYSRYGMEEGVTVYTMKDIRNRALEDIIKESLNRLEDRVDAVYVSVDMDVLDQSQAPGCPALGPGGMDSRTLLEGVRRLAEDPLVQGMDIVEIDPTQDFRNMTSRIAAHVVLNFLTGKLAAGQLGVQDSQKAGT
ncbi:formimidoylglutamase [Bacillus marinisedimentorum]|uniref:formimidoylglutamase n=1 Tax=Bacillus marinisedimentorum TaxID=1821260 RepID=UPI0008727368|nr:formimidoylglutamase [Bacillus marinisedimentorum]